MGDKLMSPLEGEQEPAIQDTQVRFYWLSVNQPIKQEYLTADYWREPSNARDATSDKLAKRSLDVSE